MNTNCKFFKNAQRWARFSTSDFGFPEFSRNYRYKAWGMAMTNLKCWWEKNSEAKH